MWCAKEKIWCDKEENMIKEALANKARGGSMGHLNLKSRKN